MITIIHGEDITSSREYYIDKKKNAPSQTSFDGETLTPTEITQTLEGGGLFSDEKHVFIDQFLSKRKPGREFLEILEIIKKNNSANIFLWEGKELSKKQVNYFKLPQIKLFAYPNILFSFLDNIKPGNAKAMINTFHKLCLNVKEELILFMLVRQFRLLLAVSGNSQDTIDEAKRLAPWQESNFKKQAGFFTKDELKAAYAKLGEIDLGLKTGSLILTSTEAIDFFLLDL